MFVDGIKAMTFDVFGTVVDWRGSIIEQFREFGGEKGIHVDWEAFVPRERYRHISIS